ncbi:MAG: type II toxin-antitoxin system VapB family antitoxin [Bacteroidota bacterium]
MIMRTALDLPEHLIDEAMKLTKINTKTQLIITALEDMIRKARLIVGSRIVKSGGRFGAIYPVQMDRNRGQRGLSPLRRHNTDQY